MTPATDFYKKLALDCSGQQVAVDLFLLSGRYSDLASLGMSQSLLSDSLLNKWLVSSFILKPCISLLFQVAFLGIQLVAFIIIVLTIISTIRCTLKSYRRNWSDTWPVRLVLRLSWESGVQKVCKKSLFSKVTGWNKHTSECLLTQCASW